MTKAKHIEGSESLSRVDRARLRWLADALERFASLPSEDEPKRVHIEITVFVDMQRELVRVLKAAGAPTKADLRGTATRLARALMADEGLSEADAARAVLQALYERGLEGFEGVAFAAPTTAAVAQLAADLRKSRARKRA